MSKASAPQRAVCVANNRGGVGKTFMTFQTSCAIATANPDKKVLVFDFSIYSELTAMFLGGTAAAEVFGAPEGVRVCKENVESEKRVEGLLKSLSTTGGVSGRASGLFGGGGLFGNFGSGGDAVDLETFGVKPSDFNDAIPANLHLVPSAGTDSFAAEAKDSPWTQFQPVMGQKLAKSIERLSDEWGAVFFDTDHLASSAMTKLALAASDVVVVPCPIDTAEFQRLYQTPDATMFSGVESLFDDVMIPMQAQGHLRARVSKMIFSKIPSAQNASSETAGGVRLPFTPNATAGQQMDALANLAYEVCVRFPKYKTIFVHGNASKRDFVQGTFTALKMVPDLPRTISTQSGVPLCAMSTQKYTTAGGISGSTGAQVLASLKRELTELFA